MTGFNDNAITRDTGGIKLSVIYTSRKHYSGASRGKALWASRLKNCGSIPDTSPDCGAHLASNSMGDKKVFPSGLIRSQRKAHHPPQPAADVNAWSHTFTPPHIFTGWTRATFTHITGHVISFLCSTDFCTGLAMAVILITTSILIVSDSVNSAQPPKRQPCVVIILITLNNTL